VKHKQVVLAVNVIIWFTVGPPIIDSVSVDKTVEEGQKVLFSCNATNDIDSNYSPKIIWYGTAGRQLKPNKNISIYNTVDHLKGQIQSVLMINSVSHTDAGVYTCRALNHPKSYTENKINLIVNCKYFLHARMYCIFVMNYVSCYVYKKVLIFNNYFWRKNIVQAHN